MQWNNFEVALAQDEKPDLILLDVVMPGISGIELCTKIREQSDVPILFVSCKNQEMDKVLGLSIGGDDYISKPFSPAELVARVKAHLRRQNMSHSGAPDAPAPQNILTAGDLKSIFPLIPSQSEENLYTLQQKNLNFWFFSPDIRTGCLQAARSSIIFGTPTGLTRMCAPSWFISAISEKKSSQIRKSPDTSIQ